MTDYIHSVLGEFDSSNAHLQIQRPKQQISNRETGASRPFTSDVPDLVSVHGTLTPSDFVTEGASLLVSFKTGPPFPGTTAFTWIITGENGRIRVSSPRGPGLGSSSSEFPVPIEVEDYATGEVKEIPWEWEDWQVPLGYQAKNTAKLYDLYYEGRGEAFGVCDFESASKRHRQIDGLLW